MAERARAIPRHGLAGLLRAGLSTLPALVVVAHPDDETIGIGGHLASLPRATVVHVTDGAPDDPAFARRAGYADPAGYAEARRRELEAAMALVGLGPEQLVRLGRRDQKAVYDLVGLARELAERMVERAPRVVFTHPYEGGHPDHDATAFAVHAAARRVAARGRQAPRIVEMSFYQHMAERMRTDRFLHRRGAPVCTVRLDARRGRQKAQMLACFETQRAILAPFSREVERFRRAPRYDFTAPAGPAGARYDAIGSPLEEREYVALAREALEALRLRGAP